MNALSQGIFTTSSIAAVTSLFVPKKSKEYLGIIFSLISLVPFMMLNSRGPENRSEKLIKLMIINQGIVAGMNFHGNIISFLLIGSGILWAQASPNISIEK